MPWHAEAELLLARGDETIPAAAAQRDMRDQVWQHQLSDVDAGTDGQDLVGGIVFTAATNPLPTWTTAKPLAFLAQTLADERLTERDKRLIQLARQLAGLR